MNTHELKCWPAYVDQVVSGEIHNVPGIGRTRLRDMDRRARNAN